MPLNTFEIAAHNEVFHIYTCERRTSPTPPRGGVAWLSLLARTVSRCCAWLIVGGTARRRVHAASLYLDEVVCERGTLDETISVSPSFDCGFNVPNIMWRR